MRILCSCFVDDKHYPRLSRYKWELMDYGNTQYAVVRIYIKGGHGKFYVIYMHRMVMWPVPKNRVVDHIDGNGRNNQEHNLRIVTQQENCLNKHTEIVTKFKSLEDMEFDRIEYVMRKDGKTEEEIKEVRENYFNSPDECSSDAELERVVACMKKDGKTETEIQDLIKSWQ